MSEGMGIHSRDEVALKSAMERFIDARVRGLAELIRSDSQALRRMIEERPPSRRCCSGRPSRNG